MVIDVVNRRLLWSIDTCDVLAGLRSLPSDCVHCVVTSPPYWGLRDYGVEGQLGLERTPAEFVGRMVEVFEEVRRVLRPDGTCWMNIMGDSYANDGKHGGKSNGKHDYLDAPSRLRNGRSKRRSGLKAKDLVGVPWMLAFALRDAGWYLRSEVIWHKRSPMPESVRDRPTKAHEQIFLLTKSERYFYDAFAGSEKAATSRARGNGASPPREAVKADNGIGFRNVTAKTPDPVDRRNARTVWTLSNESFKGAHFATFPTKLVKKCLLLGTSAKGCCEACGAPWRRRVNKQRMATRTGEGSKVHGHPHGWARGPGSHSVLEHNTAEGRASQHADSPYEGQNGSVVGNRDPQRHVTKTRTVGWEPGCQCGAGLARCLVLDPFAGAGTTPMVARRLDLRAIGFELNHAYADMARRRILDDAPLLNSSASPR